MPSTVATIREAAGANPAAIQSAVDAFRTDLGTLNPNQPGSVGSGRREINWDGVPDSFSAPNNLPANFFNSNSPRGVVFSIMSTAPLPLSSGVPYPAGGSFQVSAKAGNPTSTPILFGNLNANNPNLFQTFSSPRLFTQLGGSAGGTVEQSGAIATVVTFFVPGSSTPATVKGFGSVFTNVTSANTTNIQFLDADNQVLFTRSVQTSPTQGLSFLGVTFDDAPIASVIITSGDSTDPVVMDDFVYGEPMPLAEPIIAVGAGAGGGPQVNVFDASTQALKFGFFAFDPGFTGGVRVAAGDINGDGYADIVAGAGPGGGPNVRVIDGVTHNQISGPLGNFFAYDPGFTGGVNVAAGDVNGDGFDDVIIGADAGGGPQVRAFSGKDGSLLSAFFAYDQNFTGGVRVTVGSPSGTYGQLAILTAPGPGGGPDLHAYNSAGVFLGPVSSFSFFDGQTNGFNPLFLWLNSANVAEFGAGQDAGGAPGLSVFTFQNTRGFATTVNAYDPGFTGGVRAAAINNTTQGAGSILTGPGKGGGPQVRLFDPNLFNQPIAFFAFDPNFTGGIYVAGSRRAK